MSISVVLELKDILGQSFFVSSVSNERIDGALNVVYFSIFSSIANIKSYQYSKRVLMTAYPL